MTACAMPCRSFEKICFYPENGGFISGVSYLQSANALYKSNQRNNPQTNKIQDSPRFAIEFFFDDWLFSGITWRWWEAIFSYDKVIRCTYWEIYLSRVRIVSTRTILSAKSNIPNWTYSGSKGCGKKRRPEGEWRTVITIWGRTKLFMNQHASKFTYFTINRCLVIDNLI